MVQLVLAGIALPSTLPATNLLPLIVQWAAKQTKKLHKPRPKWSRPWNKPKHGWTDSPNFHNKREAGESLMSRTTPLIGKMKRAKWIDLFLRIHFLKNLVSVLVFPCGRELPGDVVLPFFRLFCRLLQRQHFYLPRGFLPISLLAKRSWFDIGAILSLVKN